MTDHRGADENVDALRDEIARPRTENEQLRATYRVPARAPIDQPEPTPAKAVRVLLLPDPATPQEPGRPGPQAVLGVVEVLISHLRKRQPEVDWRAEHDLEQVPPDAECFQPGDVLRRIWDGTGPLPKIYRVDEGDDGRRRLKRSLIKGDGESDRFCAGYERQLAIVEELLAEGQVADAAGAQHHAGWTLKAVDLVLARARLALATFEAGKDDWKTQLQTPRPEYEPRYSITAGHPTGW